MACDDAMLQAVQLSQRPILRFYRWTTPTLSLGYFQAAEPARRTFPKVDSWVRRPSGGAALLHHHELTYALALPRGPHWQPAGESWLIRLHQLIQHVLLTRGIEAHLCQNEQKFGDVLCFLHHTPGDLLLGACKIAGSAQRKQHGALLQHGGILLASSPLTPILPGIAELTGKAMEWETLRELMLEEMSKRWDVQFAEEEWSEEELAMVRERGRSRYQNPQWNEKR
jgi:lipoate-protein ligase A